MNAGKALGYLITLFFLSMCCFLTLVCGIFGGAAIGFFARGGTGFRPEQRWQVLTPTPVVPRVVPRAITPVPPSPTPRAAPFPQVTPRIPRSPLPLGQTGAYVLTVIANSPAERAGLRAEDLIVSANGIPIDENHPLVDVVRSMQPGDTIPLGLLRSTSKVMVNVTLGSQTLDSGQMVAYLGVTYDTWPPPGRAN